MTHSFVGSSQSVGRIRGFLSFVLGHWRCLGFNQNWDIILVLCGFQKFLSLLSFSLQVVFGEIAILTHARRVVRLFRVTTGSSHLGLSFSVITVLTHVLGIVLSVGMRTLWNSSSCSFNASKFNLNDLVFLSFLKTWVDGRFLRLSIFNVQQVLQIVVVR